MWHSTPAGSFGYTIAAGLLGQMNTGDSSVHAHPCVRQVLQRLKQFGVSSKKSDEDHLPCCQRHDLLACLANMFMRHCFRLFAGCRFAPMETINGFRRFCG